MSGILDAAIDGDKETAEHIIKDHPGCITECDSDGLTALHWACMCGHLDLAATLLKAGADSNAKTGAGSTALHDASRNRNVEAAILLLDHGANVNARSHEMNTPLHEASRGGSVEVVQVLLNRGADINAKTESGNTALHWASMWGSAEVLALLIDRGADEQVMNKHDKSVLDVVISVNETARDKVIAKYNEVIAIYCETFNDLQTFFIHKAHRSP